MFTKNELYLIQMFLNRSKYHPSNTKQDVDDIKSLIEKIESMV